MNNKKSQKFSILLVFIFCPLLLLFLFLGLIILSNSLNIINENWVKPLFEILSPGQIDTPFREGLNSGFRWGFLLGKANNISFWSLLLIGFAIGALISSIVTSVYKLKYIVNVLLFESIPFLVFLVGVYAIIIHKSLNWPSLVLIVVAILNKEIRKTIERLSTALNVRLRAPQGGEVEVELPDISSFSNLIEKLYELLEDTNSDDTFRFLAYTPALGYLALPKENWNKLQGLLMSRNKLNMLCLDEVDLKIWHDRFINRVTKRGVLTKNNTIKASETSERLIEYLKSNKEVEVKRVVFGRLPGYYIFSNGKKAIVAAPLFLPLPAGSQQDLMGQVPQMLGFETDNPLLVMMIDNIFDLYFYKVEKTPSVYFRKETSEQEISKIEGINKIQEVQKELQYKLQSVIIFLAKVEENKENKTDIDSIKVTDIVNKELFSKEHESFTKIIEAFNEKIKELQQKSIQEIWNDHNPIKLSIILGKIKNVNSQSDNQEIKIILEIRSGQVKRARKILREYIEEHREQENKIFIIDADRKYYYRLEIFEGNLE